MSDSFSWKILVQQAVHQQSTTSAIFVHKLFIPPQTQQPLQESSTYGVWYVVAFGVCNMNAAVTAIAVMLDVGICVLYVTADHVHIFHLSFVHILKLNTKF
jgi:hypothetical protein